MASSLLVLPGLILLCSPTVFLYLAAVEAIRHVPRVRASAFRNTIAFALALALGVVVMLPFHLFEQAQPWQATQEDIVPVSPVNLTGVVRLETDAPSVGHPARRCDAFCAAILELPEVRAVVPGGSEQTTQFQLVSEREHPEPGEVPLNPGDLLKEWAWAEGQSVDRMQVQSIEARWALRLTGEQRLAMIPGASWNADWVLRNTRVERAGEPSVWRVEVMRGDGTPVFRRSYARSEGPAWIFYLGFDSGLSILGPGQGASFHIGKQPLETGSPELPKHSVRVLLEAVGIRPPEADPGKRNEIRTAVDAVMREPDASAARLQLVQLWLNNLTHGATADDLPVIARVLADPRTPDVGHALREAFGENGDLTALREALVQRILMGGSSADERFALGQLLAEMPPGTFSKPSTAEMTIWTDPVLRLETAPWLGRASDWGGLKAVALLVAGLEDAVSMGPSPMQSKLKEGICDGLVALGPEAVGAVPRVRELYLMRHSPIRRDPEEARDWLVALARMGVAIEDLPNLPGESAETRAAMAQDVRRRLEKYQKDGSAAE